MFLSASPQSILFHSWPRETLFSAQSCYPHTSSPGSSKQPCRAGSWDPLSFQCSLFSPEARGVLNAPANLTGRETRHLREPQWRPLLSLSSSLASAVYPAHCHLFHACLTLRPPNSPLVTSGTAAASAHVGMDSILRDLSLFSLSTLVSSLERKLHWRLGQSLPVL